jgi:micrococcal nuclease
MYEYKAIVERVVDGDTIDVIIDLGFKTWKKVRVRMEGINTPESRTRDLEEKKRGLAAKDRLVEILEYNNNECTLKVSGVGKFGRAIASVYVETLSPASSKSSMTEINVNKQLIEEGHAVAYDGGKR